MVRGRAGQVSRRGAAKRGVCCHAGYVNDTRTRQRDGLERVVLPLYYKKKNAFLFFLWFLCMVFAEFESKSRVRHVYTHL